MQHKNTCQTCKCPIVGPARVVGALVWHQTVRDCARALLARRGAR